MTLLFGCASLRGLPPGKTAQPSALAQALAYMYLAPEEFSAGQAVSDPDVFLLQSAAGGLQAPASMLQLAGELRDQVDGLIDFSGLLHFAARLLEVGVPAYELPAENAAGGNTAVQAVRELCAALQQADLLLKEAFAGIAADDLALVRRAIEQLLFYGAHRSDTPRGEQERQLQAVFALAADIDRARIVAAGAVVAEALDNVLGVLIEQHGLLQPQTVVTPLGLVVIGGAGGDNHGGRMPLLLIDTGGDDTYRFDNQSRLSLIIDLAGNDRYLGTALSAPGSGIAGIGYIVDLQGDDYYRSELYGAGCGMLGAGVVADLGGNDHYDGRMFTQGAAALGLGILYDAQGDDRYGAELYAQGMGYVGGVGLLIDEDGSDSYLAGTSVPDGREESGAYQTYAQGFGLGVRRFASGGAGVLIDNGGNDHYQGSYFCQGSAFWQSLGLLIDTTGDDVYRSRRYSQGAGVHSAAGALVDYRGSDRYESWGVAQGSGHDFAVGLLYDAAGDDRYQADWLCQGSGNAAGLGMLLDGGGNDQYEAGRQRNIQGAGVPDPRRDLVSLGVLVDNGGSDMFSSHPGNETLWRNWLIGTAFDAQGSEALLPDGGAPLQRPLPAAARHVPANAVEDSWDDVLEELEAPLYLDASWNAAAEKLVARGPAIMPLLCRYLAIKDISVARTIEETFKKFAEADIEAVHAFLLSGERSSDDKRFLLFVLGEVADKRSRNVFEAFLEDARPQLQVMALRGLYKIGAMPPPRLWQGFAASGHAALRRYFLLSLAVSEQGDALRLLCRGLADRVPQVRFAAYRTLQQQLPRPVPFLRELLQADDLPETARRMARDLLAARQ